MDERAFDLMLLRGELRRANDPHVRGALQGKIDLLQQELARESAKGAAASHDARRLPQRP